MLAKINSVLLFLFIFLLPSQLALHLWPSWSFISTLPIDYLSPTIYLTDLLLVSQLLFNIHSLSFKFHKIYLLLFVFVILNTLHSTIPLLTLYLWLRLALYVSFTIYLTRTTSPSRIFLPLALSLLWVCGLAWLQFTARSAVGGVWYWLGERSLSLSLINVAKVSLGNLGLFLRAYSTFPHPNALAGYLLVSTTLLFSWITSVKWQLHLKYLALTVSVLTLSITFSRSAIIVFLVALFGTWLKKHPSPKGLILSGLVVIFFSSLFISFGNTSSLSDRLDLAQIAVGVIMQNFILGTGLGAFIPAAHLLFPFLSSFNYQPVHNLYLLIISEIGLPASLLLVFGCLKKLHFQKVVSPFPFLAILITAMTDHYWITSHSNLLLLIVVSAFSFSKNPNSEMKLPNPTIGESSPGT